MSLKTRVKTLERQQRQVFEEPFRLVVSHAGEPLDLAKANRTRSRLPNGHLMEEQLESFIQSFPVERRT